MKACSHWKMLAPCPVLPLELDSFSDSRKALFRRCPSELLSDWYSPFSVYYPFELPRVGAASRQFWAASPVFILENRSLSTVSRSTQFRSESSTVTLFPCCWDIWFCYSKFFLENLDPGSMRGRNSGNCWLCFLSSSSCNLRRFSSFTYSRASRKNCSISDRWSSTI